MTSERGFTIVEVLVAVMILSVGLMGLVTTAGLVTRMIAQGHRSTEATAMANERIELLRAAGCPAVGSGSQTTAPYTVAWRVVQVGGPKGRAIQVQVTSPTTRGTRSHTFRTMHFCP